MSHLQAGVLIIEVGVLAVVQAVAFLIGRRSS
jgi:hypothetical protein